MLAVDTNVVVRYVTQDHAEQSAKAKTLIDGNDVFVPTTVLLETDWVLRSGYEFTRSEIAAALRSFAGLPHVTLEDPVLAFQALTWMGRGMDLGDALHLAKSQDCDAFVSFDRRLAAVARRVGGPTLRTP
jgi:predicted nucleic-acid-binding protein